MNTFLSKATDWGYEVEEVLEHFKYQDELGKNVYEVSYLAENNDHPQILGRVYDQGDAITIITNHAKKYEPDLLK